MKSSPSLSGLVPAPGQPHVTAMSATSTSISLSWSVPSDSVVTSYEVTWREISSGGSGNSTAEANDGSGTTGSTGGGPTTVSGDGESGTSGSITDTSYTIEELRNSTSYVITVTVTNAAGNTVSHSIRTTTGPGKIKINNVYSEVTLHQCMVDSFNRD